MAVQKTRLKDIAELAGLSVSTVSRALKDDVEIAKATRVRVHKAADRLGYQPNLFARSLSTQNTRILAFLTPSLRLSDYYRSCLAAFERSGHKRGYFVLGFSVDEAGFGIREYLPLLRGGMFAGVFFLDYSFRDAQTLNLSNEVESAGVPHVVTYDDPGLPEQGHNVVRVDFAEQARQAVTHLLELGHRHIALASPAGRTQFMDGYLRAYTSLGIPCVSPEAYQIRVGGADPDDFMAHVTRIAQKLLAMEPRPTAVFVPKAIIAGPLQFALKRLGLRLPDDMAMVTTKDCFEYQYMDPPLTSVCVDVDQLADTALDMMVGVVEKQGEFAPHTVTIPTKLIVRESCGAKRSDEPERAGN